MRSRIAADMRGSRLRAPWVAIVLVTAAAAARSDGPRTFDKETVGQAPSGFTFHAARLSSAPSAPRWLVQRDGSNNFVASPGGGAADEFALAVLDEQPRADVSLSARIRLTGAKRTGGLVWRVQDADHYYLARLDLQRQDIGLYRVVNGNRTRIE